MLRKILKWIGGGIGVLVAVALIFYFLMYIVVSNKRNKIYNVEVRLFNIPSDSAAIAEGAHIYATKGCTDCHGANLAGQTFLDEAPIGRVSGANLTSGKGGRPANYTDKDWIRAMRHGLNSTGKSLLIMPSYEYYKLADDDLACLIAYCKSVPAVDNEPASFKLGPVGTILSGLDKLPLIPAAMIDHQAKHSQKMERSVSVEYGQYLSMSCTGCHKHDLKGGDNPVPGGKPVRDITTSGNIGKWSLDQFVSALRTGATPDGRQIKNEDMPWKMTNNYTEDELKALYLYLKTL